MMFDKRLNQEAKNHKLIFAALVSFAIIGGVIVIAQAWYLSWVVDQVFLRGASFYEVQTAIFIVLIVFGIRLLWMYSSQRTAINLGLLIRRSLRERLLERTVNSSTQLLLKQQTGKMVGMLTDLVDQLDGYYSKYLPQLLQAAIIPVMILVVVFMNNIYSGVIMLVTAPLIPVFMVLIGKSADKKAQQQMDSMQRFSGHFLDMLQGLATLKMFGRSKQQRARIIEMSDSFRDATLDVLKIAFLSALMLEILATISTAMIAVEVGLRLAYGQLVFQTGFFVLLLAPELYLPLKNLGASFHTGKNSMAAADEIWQHFANCDAECRGNSVIVTTADEQINPVDCDKWQVGISLENLSFSYASQQLLKNISLEISAGMRVALVGASGAGKTTLLRLLLGLLQPTAGKINFTSNDGTIIVRPQITYVPQEAYLFSGTISNNIRAGQKRATDDQVMSAAKLAGVDDFVKQLPEQYLTIVGEGGRGLSGGEKQRVALARAFLKKAAVVLLDEPTSGLDVETEGYLKQGLARLAEQATTITVAHRLQTIIDADLIIVLDHGQVIASGPHEQLLQTSPEYKAMLTAHYGGVL